MCRWQGERSGNVASGRWDLCLPSVRDWVGQLTELLKENHFFLPATSVAPWTTFGYPEESGDTSSDISEQMFATWCKKRKTTIIVVYKWPTNALILSSSLHHSVAPSCFGIYVAPSGSCSVPAELRENQGRWLAELCSICWYGLLCGGLVHM
jgi:hypothetical protein